MNSKKEIEVAIQVANSRDVRKNAKEVHRKLVEEDSPRTEEGRLEASGDNVDEVLPRSAEGRVRSEESVSTCKD